MTTNTQSTANNKNKVPGATAFLIAAFLNAFLDLGHKITVQNTLFKVFDDSTQVLYTSILNALILLPFILLLSPSGFVSDRYAKHKVMKVSAYFSLGLALLITLAYFNGWFWMAFAMTFLMAIQSAFYSPAKYGYIKELFGVEKLAPANAWVQAISIAAILLGTFAFSIGFEHFYAEDRDLTKDQIISAVYPLGWILVFVSLLEVIILHKLPNRHEGDSAKQFSIKQYFTLKEAGNLLKPLKERVAIRQSMIGLAVFWAIGQVLLAAFPAFAKQVTGVVDTVVIQGVLACTAIGIAIGSTIAGRLSKNYIELGLVPLGALGFTLALWVLPFLTSPTMMTVVFLVVGVTGGLFIVPLNALIQFHSGKDELGQMMAANNFVQNSAMLLFLVLSIVTTSLIGFTPQQLLLLMGLFALVGCGYTLYRLPHSFVRFLLSSMIAQRYKVVVQGMDNIPSKGGVLLLGNHVSWIDWAIIQLASPRPVRFVMLKSIYQKWYLNWFFKLFGSIPISAGPGSRDALDQICELLNDGEVACLFPEGAISRNGQLGEFKKGYERALENTNDDVVVLPFYLRGLWGSQFSRSSDNLKNQRKSGLKRDIIIAFGTALEKDISVDKLKQRIFDISIESWQAYAESLPSLPEAWIDTVKRTPGGVAMVDGAHRPLTPAKALASAIALSSHIKQHNPQAAVGLLLPTSMGGVLSNMAALIAGKTIVNLNYTSSTEAILHAIDKSQLGVIYTAHKFTKKLAQKGIDVDAILDNKTVVYLEDVFESFSKARLLSLFVSVRCLPGFLLKALYLKKRPADSTAVIIFTSGSEGLPKGVQLSHTNIMANLKQISDVLDTADDDVVLACLPLFHAFGLTVTQFMPLIESIPMVCHPDPTDAVGLGKMVARYRATIMCSTSTFLRLYCKNSRVNPLMLDSVRLVVAGAEKLNPAIREAFTLKFNKPIYEGYGATETTPVASVNIPDRLSQSDWKVQKGNRLGTVGLPLPGTSFKVVDPNSFAELATGEAGMILIGGAQVMQGYLDAPDKTNQVIKLMDGIRWYVSGDKGFVNEDGFLTIVDRYSRFAKIAGEMISLSVVEALVNEALLSEHEDLEVVAVGLPDDKKGEQVILLTNIELELSYLKQVLLERQTNPLQIPAKVVYVDELPKLGSGKVDFAGAKRIANESIC